MKHLILGGIVALFATGAAPSAHAQLVVSPAQRCVWQCLGGRSATDPAYHQCVADHCAGLSEDTDNPTEFWQSGSAGTGLRWAGIDHPERPGEVGLYYFCRGGTGKLAVVGAPVTTDRLTLVVNGQSFSLTLDDAAGGSPAARLMADSAIFDALSSAGRSLVMSAGPFQNVALGTWGAYETLYWAAEGC